MACFVICVCTGFPLAADAALPEYLREPLARAFQEAVGTNGGSHSGGAVLMALDGLEAPRKALVDVLAFCTAQWIAGANATVLDREHSEELLGGMLLEKKDLLKKPAREAFFETAGADVLILTSVRSKENKLSIRLTLCRPGQAPVRREVTAEKTDDLLRYLGEPVPGTLSIRAPDEAYVYADGRRLGTGDLPLSCRLKPGRHEIRVTKSGYEPYTTMVRVNSEQEVQLEIRQKDNSAAPLLSFLASAAVPGLGSVIYGRPRTEQAVERGPEVVAYGAALVFYAAAAMWIVDESQDAHFLSTDSRDRFETAQKVELITAGAAYAVNLVAAVLVGKQYADKHRQLVSSVK